MKKKSIILIIIGLFAFLVIGAVVGASIVYFSGLKPVSSGASENVVFTVSKGEATNTIIANLKAKGLIKSEISLKIYFKLHQGAPIAGDYVLNPNMSAEDIYEALVKGDVTYDTVWVTFVEGKRLTYIASVISSNFDYTEEEILKTLDDTEYIKELIAKYDFLTDDILNSDIYHPLEGYLFPDTYEFLSSASLKEIIEAMLNNTASKLSAYSKEIEENEYSVHEIMTLASIVELEGANSDDRRGVAGVFYNRLASGNRLGSDATTYYAVGKDFSVDLTQSDLRSCNGYNTREEGCHNGLPVGPIATASFESLKAAIDPEEHDYLFFVADKNGKTYFNKTYSKHVETINELKRNGLWYEY